MPFFAHRFTPASASPLGTTVDLTVQEVEDAGILEVLQTPGVALGTWGILDALLQPGSTEFLFRAPLGQAHEVKTAVSGLFGRFVARAYATRYLGYSHFAHVTKPPMPLVGPMHGVLRRTPRVPKGDMPDWLTWGASAGLGIVEAKGCHDRTSPKATLERARRQALRAEIAVGGRRATFKRYAIATRWGHATPVRTRPMLWVHDPDEDGSETPEEAAALAVGVRRYHIASLLRPLGYVELADTLVQLVRTPYATTRDRAGRRARELLAAAPSFGVDGTADTMLGSVIVRGGSRLDKDLSIDDRETLTRLDLAPTFVGIDIAAVKETIDGEAPSAIKISDADRARAGDGGAGGRIVRLDRERGVQRRT